VGGVAESGRVLIRVQYVTSRWPGAKGVAGKIVDVSTSPARMVDVEATIWLDPEQQRAWQGWLEVHAQLAARINRDLQATSGLSHADYAILVQLTDPSVPDGVLRMYELGERLLWEKSRVSKQVSRMEARGLLGRRDCPDDRRGAFVELTAAGRAAIEAAAPAHVAMIRQIFFDGASEEEITALATLTERVLGRLAGPAPSVVE
jgi:DNA-binding MarR family transcriptional regulator